MPNNTAEPANIHSLCSLMVNRNGKALVNATTVAPNPTPTRIIGSAQHTNVPVDTKSARLLKPTPLFRDATAIVPVPVFMPLVLTLV